MKIICDTREKKDYFTFATYDDVEVISYKLKTGDYSIEGYENKITIDRKRTSGEFYINLGSSSKRVKKEMDRMVEFDHAYFVMSFPESDLLTFPKNSGIPYKRWKYLKMGAPALRKTFYEIREQYPSIEFIFCDDNYEAEKTTYNLLKEYYDKQNNKN